jgi:hypothetical protein
MFSFIVFHLILNSTLFLHFRVERDTLIELMQYQLLLSEEVLAGKRCEGMNECTARVSEVQVQRNYGTERLLRLIFYNGQNGVAN